jgi:hypothetical protein
VGNWLYGVAVNTARKARAMARDRRAKEREAAARPRPEGPPDDWGRLQAVLDEELPRLPDKYRVPIVLCDLEGRTLKEAARQLGWPPGPVASRLSRGRALLARRLRRGGLPLAGGAAALLSERAALAVPGPLVNSTVKAAALFAAGPAAAGGVSAPVAALTDGVLKAMLMSKLKVAAGLLLTAAVVVAGAAGFTYGTHAQPPITRGTPADESAPRTAPPQAERDTVERLRSALRDEGKKDGGSDPPAGRPVERRVQQRHQGGL